MSDTPETDRQWAEWLNKLKMPIESFVDFARKLERERDQWRECAERLDARLRKSTDYTPYATYKDNQQALAEFDRLKEETL